MKILNITAQKPFYTGSGVYLSELIKAFEKMGHSQAIVCGISNLQESKLINNINAKAYPVIYNTDEIPFEIPGMSDEMPYSSTRYKDMSEKDFELFKNAYIKRISAAVSDFEPDLIICHHLYLLTGITAEYFSEYKVVGVCHGTCLRQLKSHYLYNDKTINSLRKLSKIYALHDYQQNEIINLLGQDISEKLEIIGTGYNPDIFTLESNDNNIDNEVLKIIYAGKISRKKGLVELIHALSSIDPQDIGYKSIKLSLAGGNGSLYDVAHIKEAASDSPHKVKFLGILNHDQLSKEFNRSDLFVLPSFYEGLPLVVIEAIACGLHAVTTATPGLRDWIEGNIKNSPVEYVELPLMKNMDEPVESELPSFEARLADSIKNSVIKNKIMQKRKCKVDMSRFTWAHVADKIIKEP
ncbi:glycosyltransferase family 4 protein [Proteocatella sphenisci]|uniref:glycosyltransferase family 4 protein n=1 Tax=Proteocatella sphenisci TaxID=181070 RepID=UPI00048F383A|nr:glycosyltransferase family 4 protein [Proteocatella sphenisci]